MPTRQKRPAISKRRIGRPVSLEAHELAALLPRMSEAELQSLTADIGRIGQRDPIELFEGKILDGRNRYEACGRLGIKPKTSIFRGSREDALALVYSRANHRNLSESQRAMAAAKFLPHLAAAAAKRKAAALKQGARPGINAGTGEARDQAGEIFGVSGRYVGYAKSLLERDSKLAQEVFEGRLKITSAKRLVERNDQRRAIKLSPPLSYNADDFQFHRGLSQKVLPTLKRRSVRLVFADPPYNCGVEYDADPTRDRLPAAHYYRLISGIVNECCELLAPDGALCLMICEEHLGAFDRIIRDAGLHLRRLIVWHESFGQCGHTNFGRTCRFIFYATKHPTNFVFNEAAALIDSKRAMTYGDSRAMPGGKVADQLWEFSRVAGTFRERLPDAGIPTQLPVALVKRAIAIFTDPGDTVLDPFAGTGTTARAALSLGRKCISIDRSKLYTQIAKRELAKMSAQPAGPGKEAA